MPQNRADRLIDLRRQIEAAIKKMEEKLRSENETIVQDYLHAYRMAAALLGGEAGSSEAAARAKSLIGCARGYLETSSCHEQDFLKEMAATEKMIKQIWC